MKKIDQRFQTYSESHQNATNKTIHWICVPLIFWSIVGLLSCIPMYPIQMDPLGPISAVLIAAFALVCYYYFKLSPPLTFVMVCLNLFFIISVAAINKLLAQNSVFLYISVFAISWVFQFIGHKIEGKKPSFLQDIQFLLIGPLWLLHFIFKKLDIKY